MNIEHLIDKVGLERVGFMTLTFGHSRGNRQQYQCYKRASQRFNSFATHILSARYQGYIRVMERHHDGVVHYHLLVVMNQDIRTNFNFDAVKQKDYRSVTKCLRDEWAYLRKIAPLYGFGRTELHPIRSSGLAIARYVAKYISKHMQSRLKIDKGARLVSYSKGVRVCSTRFQFLSDGSADLRRKIALFAALVASHYDVEPSYDSLRSTLGAKWFWNNKDFIMSLGG